MISGGLLLVLSVLIFIAILVTKVGSRFGVPSLLLFLVLGMVAGEDGLGFQFASYETADSLCHFAVTFILFDAGLKTSLRETRPVFRQGVLLSSLLIYIFDSKISFKNAIDDERERKILALLFAIVTMPWLFATGITVGG